MIYQMSVVGRKTARMSAVSFADSSYEESKSTYNHVLSLLGGEVVKFLTGTSTIVSDTSGYIEYATAVGIANDVGKIQRVRIGLSSYVGLVTTVNSTGLAGQTGGTFAIEFHSFGSAIAPELLPGPTTIDVGTTARVSSSLSHIGKTIYISPAPVLFDHQYAWINEYRYKIISMGVTSISSGYIVLDREPPKTFSKIVMGHDISDGRDLNNWVCSENPVISVTENNLFTFRDVFKSGRVYKLNLINTINDNVGGTITPQTFVFYAPLGFVQTQLVDTAVGRGYIQLEFDDEIDTLTVDGITTDNIIYSGNIVTIYTTESGRKSLIIRDITDKNGNAVLSIEKVFAIPNSIRQVTIGEYAFRIQARKFIDIADTTMDKVIEWATQTLK